MNEENQILLYVVSILIIYWIMYRASIDMPQYERDEFRGWGFILACIWPMVIAVGILLLILSTLAKLGEFEIIKRKPKDKKSE